MKLSDFLDTYKVNGHYATDRKLMSNNREGEVICFVALFDSTGYFNYQASGQAVSWAIVFRGSHRKTLYAFVSGRREWKVKKVVDYIKQNRLDRQLPNDDLDKELMLYEM
jgi:hypothetical protein